MLDPSNPAHARADRRLRSEPVAWLTTVRADGQAQSTPVWFLWDGDTLHGLNASGRSPEPPLGVEGRI